jgi:Inhibitor of growth proteins N-terminal histone-binding
MTEVATLTDVMANITFDGLPIDTEAQSVITDFLDYTEYLPSDLFRSFTLIQTLDKQYHQHLDKIHELTGLYGRLPSLPPNQRPDALALRRDISAFMDKAYRCRDCAYAEIVRLNDTVKGHTTRLSTIKSKLEALPKPPSRDPTPVPVSPIRRRKSDAATTPKLKLNLSEKKRGRKPLASSGLPPDLPDDSIDSDSDMDDIPGIGQFRRKTPKQKIIFKTPKSRGSIAGSNVHSAIAGISTSNALAKLTPPPTDAVAGSRWRPWFKLTEYEMAKLRKQMKKNAVWTPSEAMIRRELVKDGRGKENYERAKSEAEELDEQFLDEEPVDGSKSTLSPGELDRRSELLTTSTTITNAGMKLNEAKRLKKERAQEAAKESQDSTDSEDELATGADHTPEKGSQETPGSQRFRDKRPRTRGEAQKGLQLANKKMEEAFHAMRNLFRTDQPPLTPTLISPQKEESGRSTRKRKRNSEKDAAVMEHPVANGASPSPKHKGGKRQKTQNQLHDSEKDQSISPVKTVTTTTTVPLAPEGPSINKSGEDDRLTTSPSDQKKRGTTPTATAAFSRPRRISQAPTKIEEQHQPSRHLHDLPLLSPPPPSSAHKNSTTPAPRSTRATRHASTTKAASAEPPAIKRDRRDLRRLSINAETAPSSPSALVPRRRSGRRALPGLVTAEEDGKGKVSIGRRRAKPTSGKGGASNKKEEKREEESDVDADEERYCICGDVSYGTMIACDNDAVSFVISIYVLIWNRG